MTRVSTKGFLLIQVGYQKSQIKTLTLLEIPLFGPHTCKCRYVDQKEISPRKKINNEKKSHAGGMRLLLTKGLSNGCYSPTNLTRINKSTFTSQQFSRPLWFWLSSLTPSLQLSLINPVTDFSSFYFTFQCSSAMKCAHISAAPSHLILSS